MSIRLKLWSCRFLATSLLSVVFLFLGPTTLVGQETDAKIRQIEARFVSPCCWRENLAVHGSQVAEQLRDLVATLVRSGKTEPQIVDYFVARFGERILREPRGTRFRLLTITPIFALGIGFLLVVRFLARARHSPLDEASAVSLPLALAEEVEWP